MSAGAVDVLARIRRARDVLAEIYTKHQVKIGPFATQAQQSNVELRQVEVALAELIEAVGVRLELADSFNPSKNERKRLRDLIGGFDPSIIPNVQQLRRAANKRVRNALATVRGGA